MKVWAVSTMVNLDIEKMAKLTVSCISLNQLKIFWVGPNLSMFIVHNTMMCAQIILYFIVLNVVRVFGNVHDDDYINMWFMSNHVTYFNIYVTNMALLCAPHHTLWVLCGEKWTPIDFKVYWCPNIPWECKFGLWATINIFKNLTYIWISIRIEDNS